MNISDSSDFVDRLATQSFGEGLSDQSFQSLVLSTSPVKNKRSSADSDDGPA